MRAAATALILVIVLYYAVHSRFRLWCTIEVLQTKVFTRKQPANQSPVANFGDSGFVHYKERPEKDWRTGDGHILSFMMRGYYLFKIRKL